MNLKRWYSRYKQHKFMERIAANKAHETERALCLAVLESVNTTEFALYHASKGLGININTPYANVDLYCETLRTLCRTVKSANPLRVIDIRHAIKPIQVDSFFINGENFYQNVELAVTRFRKVAMELCVLLEPTDDAEYGLDEFNRRAISPLLENIRHIFTVLTEVSLTD